MQKLLAGHAQQLDDADQCWSEYRMQNTSDFTVLKTGQTCFIFSGCSVYVLGFWVMAPVQPHRSESYPENEAQTSGLKRRKRSLCSIEQSILVRWPSRLMPIL